MSILNVPIQIRRGTAAQMPGVLLVGELYFQTDTNKLYAGTGSGVSQVGGSIAWGLITGSITTQSDLQTALNGKQASLGFTPENTTNKDTDGTLAANSDTRYASQKAAKTYVDAETTRATAAEALKAPLASPVFTGAESLVNTTPATLTVPQNSPTLKIAGQFWSGTASAEDAWSIRTSLKAGANGPSALLITQSGTSGTQQVIISPDSSATGYDQTAGHPGLMVSYDQLVVGQRPELTLQNPGTHGLGQGFAISYRCNGTSQFGLTWDRTGINARIFELRDQQYSHTILYADCTAGSNTVKIGGQDASSTTFALSLANDGSVTTFGNLTVGGTGTLTLPSQAQNTIFAAPSSGSGVPAFRVLVGSDLPLPASSTLGGVKSLAAVTHKYVTSIGTDGVPVAAQPVLADLSDTPAANLVVASPNGSSGALVARALVAADMPAINAAGLGGFFGPGLDMPATGAVNTPFAGIANQVRFIQFTLKAAYSLANVCVNITAAVAASKAGLAIYDKNKNIIASSGAIDSSGTGVINSAFGSVVLPPGVYYYAWSSTSTSVQGHGLSAWTSGGEGTMLNKNATRYGTAATASAAGVMPASLGVLTADITFNVISCFWEG